MEPYRELLVKMIYINLLNSFLLETVAVLIKNLPAMKKVKLFMEMGHRKQIVYVDVIIRRATIL